MWQVVMIFALFVGICNGCLLHVMSLGAGLPARGRGVPVAVPCDTETDAQISATC